MIGMLFVLATLAVMALCIVVAFYFVDEIFKSLNRQREIAREIAKLVKPNRKVKAEVDWAKIIDQKPVAVQRKRRKHHVPQ